MDGHWIDAVFAGIMLVSLGLGWMRGFVFEVMSLLGWVVAYAVALWVSPLWAPSMPIGRPGGSLNTMASFGLSFMGTLMLWSLIAQGVRMLIRSSTVVSKADRTLGSFFGLLRGMLILLCAATLVSFTPWSHSAEWRTAFSVPWLNQGLMVLRPLLPYEISRFFPRFHEG